MRWLVATCVVAVVLGGTGCGGGDESSADTAATITETVATDETTTDEATMEDDTTSGDTTPGGTDLSAFTSEDCLAFIGAAAAVSQAFSGVAGDIEQSEVFEEYADRVPDDIRADLQVLADAGAAAAAAYSDLDVAPGETPSAEQLAQYTAALEAIDQEEVNAASERVGAWTEEVCPGG